MLLSMFIIILLVKSKPVCEVDRDGLTLAEFNKDSNALHEMMDPVLRIVSKISQSNKLPFKVQKIDCGVCKCEDVQKFPTFKLYKNREIIDSFFGFKSYDNLIKFLSKEIKEDIFHKTVDTPGEIVELEERDFYSGFKGPWLVLFYQEDKEEVNKLLKQVLDIFEGGVKIGKIKHSRSQSLPSRFQIKSYPMIYGLYEGLSVPLLEEITLHNLIKFTEKLVEPTFKNVTYREMLSLSQDTNGPIYVVLHQDEQVAIDAFFKYAHNFKFRARLYNSSDPELFKKANVFPKEDPRLIVFKNGEYHIYEGNVYNEGTLVEWLFHTHFPNVTKISDTTFHSVFNGIKPVFLLLTESDHLNPQLERFANDVHLGKPYLHFLFSSINLDEYVLFTSTLLPKIEVPTFVVYNPTDKKFYHKKRPLNEKTFKEVAEETLRLFEQGKLKAYGEKNSRLIYYFIIAGCVAIGGCYLYSRKKANRLI